MNNASLLISFAAPVVGLVGLVAFIAVIHYAWVGIRYLSHRDDEEVDDRIKDRKIAGPHGPEFLGQEVDDRIKATPITRPG